MTIKRPFLRVPTKLLRSLIPADIFCWLEYKAARQGVGVAAVAREIITREYARDTQHPASTPESSGLAPVSQQGGDDTPTPACGSIRDETDPGGSAAATPAAESEVDTTSGEI